MKQLEIKSRLTRAAVILALMLTATTAWAESLGVDYIDANGVLQNTATDGIDGNDSPTVLTNETDVSNIAGGWYVVTGDVSYSSAVICGSGDMHLILADGAKLTVTDLNLGYGNLTIYAQSTGDGMGELSSTGGVSSNTGNITICGGKITVSGQYADIHAENTVTIHSGRVTASADEDGFYGIYVKKNVILGLRNATDFINASGFGRSSGSISIAAGQALTDGTTTYSGTLYDRETPANGRFATLDELNAALGGKTLTPTWEGSGTSASDPYLIKSTTQLNLLAQRVNAGGNNYGNNYENTYFQLGDDITYTYTTAWNDATSTENNYTAIGCNGHSFGGHFDGNGKTISGIRIYKGGDKFQGLFGNNFKAEVKNVILADARITGYTRTGGIVGFNSSSTVSGCHVGSDVSILVVQDNAQDIGGIAGGCYHPAEVSGCTSAASITTTASNTIYIGGIVGYNENNSTVTDCLYLGSNLNGNTQVGAIVGRNFGGIIKNSYYTSTTITGKDVSGNELANASCAIGLDYGTITNCGLTQNTITIGTGVALTNATDYTLNGTGLTGYGDFALSYNNGTTTNIYALEGATVTINYNGGAIPANTFWKVTYIDGNYEEKDVTVTDNQNGTYSFTMPAYDVTAAVYKDFTQCTAYVPNQTPYGSYICYKFWDTPAQIGALVKDGDKVLTVGTDYEFGQVYYYNTDDPDKPTKISTDTENNVGERFTVEIRGKGDYSGTVYAHFEIIGDVANGNWGDLTWSLSEGTLTITGSGAMQAAASYDGYPWYKYASTINTINLDDNITTIAAAAFGGTNNVNPYAGVTTVSLPSTLESIGDNAFAYCTALTFNIDDILTNTKVTLANISPVTPFNQVAKIIGTLYDGKDNTQVYDMMAFAQKADVTIKGRTLYKDGDWNTLCLPFEVALEGSPLEGATVKQLDVTGIYDDKQTGLDGTTLNLFFKSATSIEAGVPCLVKWTTGEPLTGDLVFNDVKVHSGMNNVTSQDGKVSFKGIYSPVSWTEENKSVLYLGSANKLYWPAPTDAEHPVSLNAFRAYFEASPDPSEGGEQAALQIYMNFEGEGETTGIVEAEANSSLFTIHSSLSEWHTINGVKLSGKPTKPGLYINNGRKVVVK